MALLTCFGCSTASNKVAGSTDAATTGGASSAGGASNATGGLTSVSTQTNPSACQATPAALPATIPLTRLDPDVVARAAVAVGACYPDDGIDRNATHIWTSTLGTPRDYATFTTQLTCLANSNCGCGGLKNCWGYEVTTVATNCTTACQGNVFIGCSDRVDMPDGYQVTLDCAKLGLTCDNAATFCADGPADACDINTYQPSCDANQNPTLCQNGVVARGPACAALGLDCNAGRCVGRGSACTGQNYSDSGDVELDGLSCSGSTLTACVNQHQTTVDCATLGPGFTCQTVGSQYFCGLANQCAPASNGAGSTSNPVTCEGNTVVFCNAGRLERIDCLSLGFTGCDVNHSAGRYGCI